jgi:hypothetical protein
MRAMDAVFPAVVLIKGQYGSQDTGDPVLSRVAMDDIVRTRPDTVAAASTEPPEGQLVHRPGRPERQRRFARSEAQDAC